jgi:hypothetical protein
MIEEQNAIKLIDTEPCWYFTPLMEREAYFKFEKSILIEFNFDYMSYILPT